MTRKFESDRMRRRRQVVAAQIIQTQRSVTAADVAVAMRAMGFKVSRGAVVSVLQCLRLEHGWVLWRPAKRIYAYHPGDVSPQEERALRLQMGYVTPSAPSWHKATFVGWPDLVAYIHAAAQQCGVVKGYRWYYYGEPTI